MTADRLARIILFIIFGIIGWYVGTVIAGSSDLTLATLKWTIPATLIGAVVGALIAPYLSTKPARSVRRRASRLVPMHAACSDSASAGAAACHP